MGEYTPFGDAANAFINSLNLGLTIIPDMIHPGDGTPGIVHAHPLTVGCATLYYAATSRVSGGTVLFGTQTSDLPFVMAANPP
jgi:hypothetical protein